MRTYEIMFIVQPNTSDDDLHKLVSQLETVITDRGGKLTKTDYWGRRKLAYQIKKFDEGIYTILYLEGSGREIAEVERRLRVNDLVLRHLTVRTDEDLKRAEKMKARRKTAAATGGAETDADELDEDEGEDEGFDR
ncbi:MAG TPA: 30S ribosomal protein S6 [Blastocatellia bacterium]|nr:30S ribosomal protein S6 [Blastocatellia bacterium]